MGGGQIRQIFGAIPAVKRQFEMGRFSRKTQKLLTKFPGLAISGRHNSAMITDRRKFTAELSLYRTGYLVSIFAVRINSKFFPLCYTLRIRKVPTQIFGNG